MPGIPLSLPERPRGSDQPGQSTATSRAAHTWRIRASLRRPRRSTSVAIDTLSTESRLTADRSGIGSSPGSRTTSLAKPRIVVVQGAIRARRSFGMAASRDSTTTGRRPMAARSHHHTPPRAGTGLTRRRLPHETRPGHPSRLLRQAGVRRRRRNSHRSRLHDTERSAPRALRQAALRP